MYQDTKNTHFGIQCESSYFDLNNHCDGEYALVGFILDASNLLVTSLHQDVKTNKTFTKKSGSQPNFKYVKIAEGRNVDEDKDCSIDNLELHRTDQVFFTAFKMGYLAKNYKNLLFTKYNLVSEYSYTKDDVTNYASLKCEGLDPINFKTAHLPDEGSGSGETHGSPIPPEFGK
jgi:hypothetical protein